MQKIFAIAAKQTHKLSTISITAALIITIGFLAFTHQTSAQISQGAIIDNTNLALPSSYNFIEYVFPEPNDEGTCSGVDNNNSVLQEVFISQTHRQSLDHPFYFTIGHRPALFQVALTGSGESPDVKIKGFLEDTFLGELCLYGPDSLPNSIDIDTPDFVNYFSVTIPKSWVRQDLSLELYVGTSITRLISQEDLKVGPYTELNLVMVEQDVLDYNLSPHNSPIIENFLQETASAFPASVVRYGVFPERLVFPQLVAANDQPEVVRLGERADMTESMDDGWINSVMALMLGNLHKATGDYLSTFYFGNTLNLAPGGWGGGKSFVSPDFDDVYIHELGHAFSLPHWGETSLDTSGLNPRYDYLYPYSPDNNGGGRGEAWNFIQDIYEFRDPICQYQDRGDRGIETSDAMQRNNHCLGKRSNSQGPWDGFGDFSALAMHNYLVGTKTTTGSVSYRGDDKEFQLRSQPGFPIVTLQNGIRTYSRDLSQIGNGIPSPDSIEVNFVPRSEAHNQDAYLIYGTIHPTQPQGNIVYRPISFNGTIPSIYDPTSSSTITDIRTNSKIRAQLDRKDITLKITYKDGSVIHAINPWSSPARPSEYAAFENPWYGRWRYDLDNFSLVVPRGNGIEKIELYHLPINLVGLNETSHLELMDDAVFMAEWSEEAESAQIAAAKAIANTLNAPGIGDKVWYDLNRNGIYDSGEPGISGVSMYLWVDTNADGTPDAGLRDAVTVTDSEGQYRYSRLEPGTYNAFVWMVNNYGVGIKGPLAGMIPSINKVSDPNNDIDNDNNACHSGANVPITLLSCNTTGGGDISSGVIYLSDSDEPINDGDASSIYAENDSMGNMTIDFGFHYPDDRAFYINRLLVIPNLQDGDKNYYLELEQVSGSRANFTIKSIRVADLRSEYSAVVNEFGRVEISRLQVNGLRYKAELNIDQLGRLESLLTTPIAESKFVSVSKIDIVEGDARGFDTRFGPEINNAPTARIIGGDRAILISDNKQEEAVSFTAIATDIDGSIASQEWIIDGAVVGTGRAIILTLPYGETNVSFKVTDDEGAVTTSSSTITVAYRPNIAPTALIIGGDRTIFDSDNKLGEAVSFTGKATDIDGSIASQEWIIDGTVVGTNLATVLTLPYGETNVSLKVTDDEGASTTFMSTVTIAYTPSTTWPTPFNGISPDLGYGLAINNIGNIKASALGGISYETCAKVYSSGSLIVTDGNPEIFDITFELIDPSSGLLRLTRFRNFNEIGALTINNKVPDCSGIFEVTTSRFTDTFQFDSRIFEAEFSLINPENLNFELISIEEKETPKPRLFLLAGQSNMEGNIDTGLANEIINELGKTEITTLAARVENSLDNWYRTNDDGYAMYAYSEENISFLASELLRLKEDDIVGGKLSRPSETVVCSFNDSGLFFLEQNCGKPFGPELTLGHYLAKNNKTPTSLIKVAAGGTTLYTDWLSPSAAANAGRAIGPQYEALKTRINSLQSAPESINADCVQTTCDWSAFIWFQGENDSFDIENANSYEESLRAFIADIRIEARAPNLPVVIVGTGYWAQSMDFGTVVATAQQTVADEDNSIALVRTNDLSRFFHYDPPSQMIIGERIGIALERLLSLTE
jgi:hypothetical protein